jgi:hypothetical protein
MEDVAGLFHHVRMVQQLDAASVNLLRPAMNGLPPSIAERRFVVQAFQQTGGEAGALLGGKRDGLLHEGFEGKSAHFLKG